MCHIINANMAQKKQTNNMFSSPTSKSHEMYTSVKDSFGVQMNNLKQICFLERQRNSMQIVEALNCQRYDGLSHAVDVAREMSR